MEPHLQKYEGSNSSKCENIYCVHTFTQFLYLAGVIYYLQHSPKIVMNLHLIDDIMYEFVSVT